MSEPKRVAQMKDFGKGVRDFIYLPKYQTAFLALSDMNIISRMDSYFTNFTMPWEKKKDKKEAKSVLTEEAISTVGALKHYRVIEKQGDKKNDDNRWHYQPNWAKTYASQTNILYWCEDSSTLFLGLDSGMIHRYECDKAKYLLAMKELPEISVHNTQQRVMGIAVDSRVNHMFSISESGYLIVTDLSDNTTSGGKFMSS